MVLLNKYGRPSKPENSRFPKPFRRLPRPPVTRIVIYANFQRENDKRSRKKSLRDRLEGSHETLRSRLEFDRGESRCGYARWYRGAHHARWDTRDGRRRASATTRFFFHVHHLWPIAPSRHRFRRHTAIVSPTTSRERATERATAHGSR